MQRTLSRDERLESVETDFDSLPRVGIAPNSIRFWLYCGLSCPSEDFRSLSSALFQHPREEDRAEGKSPLLKSANASRGLAWSRICPPRPISLESGARKGCQDIGTDGEPAQDESKGLSPKRVETR